MALARADALLRLHIPCKRGAQPPAAQANSIPIVEYMESPAMKAFDLDPVAGHPLAWASVGQCHMSRGGVGSLLTRCEKQRRCQTVERDPRGSSPNDEERSCC